ncbi:uncharacterized protein LOC112351040 isoform X2 [Selaginella moellendorffii]|uniref:uncharacterized protein LOC112351040 isoform X2 n=1 Tax=Selaginella moellendorffii TaxID=88036 RepID=UPI000D1C3C4D|nr:uncharacterized protein LOC112351040 isoform X2 [Selaginella moellendorffii]|eukprot:XP_024543958.1 uncharacterized protein LOC112351040 isoform X2 [Selaginella moellendorffii]
MGIRSGLAATKLAWCVPFFLIFPKLKKGRDCSASSCSLDGTGTRAERRGSGRAGGWITGGGTSGESGRAPTEVGDLLQRPLKVMIHVQLPLKMSRGRTQEQLEIPRRPRSVAGGHGGSAGGTTRLSPAGAKGNNWT